MPILRIRRWEVITVAKGMGMMTGPKTYVAPEGGARDTKYILKKLEIDPAEWQKILDAPPTPDSAYFSQMGLLRLAQKILGKNKLENIRKKQQSGK